MYARIYVSQVNLGVNPSLVNAWLYVLKKSKHCRLQFIHLKIRIIFLENKGQNQ